MQKSQNSFDGGSDHCALYIKPCERNNSFLGTLLFVYLLKEIDGVYPKVCDLGELGKHE